MKDRKLILNAIKTPDGTILISRTVHDFNCHIDKVTNKRYCVDGGLEYLKRSCEVKDYTEFSLYSYDNIETIREYFEWGTYGKSGKEPLTYIKLKDMEETHIENILENLVRLSEHMKDVFKRELKYRLLQKFKALDNE